MEKEGHTSQLWAPWRYAYVSDVGRKRDEGCVFCQAPRKSDEEALILYRGKSVYAILNRYPYNNGHLMIVPYRHVARLEELDMEELVEMMKVLRASLKALQEAYKPDGFNVGVNIGKAAGAGIEGHVHVHVVPRWFGDTNYMAVLAGVTVIPQLLSDSYKMLKPLIDKYMGEER
ncbi:MAG: HIT domain-containing protein [Acidilobaceae archaeon]|nr:HIT domain-containing protein [Acidilobaceae archaeon]MCX8165517.1 HIT domain-containing protein [Acidilobaceae archaeon]MDW7973944.1 HIT domain-containing protein [Sulfolobales archaeon]